MMGMGLGFGLVGLLVLLLIFGGLGLLAMFFVRAIFPSGGQSATIERQFGESAKEILNQRYARGEITREQYELMKADLTT